MSAPTVDVLIPGSYFADVIFTGCTDFPALGTEIYTKGLTVTVGGSLNTVIALSRLGTTVAWAGQLGSDFFSDYTRGVITREGIDLRFVEDIDAPLQRVTVAVSYPHDRAFITYVDPTASIIDLARSALARVTPRHLHFSGLYVDPRMPNLLDAVRAAGTRISMDCQDRPYTLESPGVTDILSRLDAFMPNASEALRLTGAETLPDAAARLLGHTPMLVVKDGAQGAHLWRGQTYLNAPALDVTPIDTTGAGDVFNAGFLTAWLDGRDWADCLRWGNLCGGLSTQGIGGTTNAPSRSQIEALLT